MLLFVYTSYYSQKACNFTCRYFKLSWNTTALSQSNCRNFSCNFHNIRDTAPLMRRLQFRSNPTTKLSKHVWRLLTQGQAWFRRSIWSLRKTFLCNFHNIRDTAPLMRRLQFRSNPTTKFSKYVWRLLTQDQAWFRRSIWSLRKTFA